MSRRQCERDGEWPNRCKLCIDNDLPCTENERAPGAPVLHQSIASAADLERQYDLTLRIAWLRRLRLYATSAQAIRESWETMFGQLYTPQLMKDHVELLHSDQNAVAVGITANLCEVPSSSHHPASLLSPPSLFFLLDNDVHRFQSDPTYRQSSLASVDFIDRARNVDDVGLALIVQELRLVNLLCSDYPNQEEVATELGRYHDVHRQCASRWKAAYGFEAAGMPLLHCLFLLTKGKGFLLLTRDSSHLMGEKDMFQRSILHVALDLGADETALRLLNKLAAGKDVFGRSLLHLVSSVASTGGSAVVIALLSQHKADVGSTDYLGRQALHYASASGRASIFKLLLGNGADVKSKDCHGRTPLMLAKENRHSEIVSLLLQSTKNMVQAPDLCRKMPLREPMQIGQGTTVRSQPAKDAAADSAGNLHPAPLWMAGAGYLLYWPCVNEMLHDLLGREGIKNRTEFPIQLEEQRGLLLAYRDRKPTYVYETAEIPRDMGCSPTGSPAQRDSSGYMSGIGPEGITGSRTLVRNQSGPADFSEPTVWTYVKSFEQNIHIMHPIILPQKLREMVQRFLGSIPKPSKDFATTATLVPQSLYQATLETPETRRNRLPDPNIPGPPQVQYRTGRPAHTVSNAVVLTILALGKICLYRESVPNIVCGKDHQGQGIRNGDPSPSAHASPARVYHPGAASSSSVLKETERPKLYHQQSSEASSGSSARAMYDAVPGLEYFEMATDIIKYPLVGTTLDHVYANLFAGLYYGQLGRVVESHAYISHGCTTLMGILRPSLKRLSALGPQDEQSLEDNRLLLAFWTGLQLESDIIAEIPRHQSGILRLENNFPYPHVEVWLKSWLQGDPSATELANSVIRSYIAQLYLRRHLNWIHSDIYTISTSPVDPADLLCKIREALSPVAGLTWVPDTHTFTEDDQPATDILSARLRAKYWGSQVVTYRPCIKLILDLSYKLRRKEAGPRGPSVKVYEDLQPDTINQVESLPRGVWEYARKGIRALVESTRAFHGLGFERPIITNVFGTAHAQWGNLVVLAACYRDPFLRQEIDGNKLRDLFERTIYFLRQVSTPDSALRVDQRLLEGIYQRLFFTS